MNADVKIALILAHQRVEQIKNPNVLSAISNCAIRFANTDDEQIPCTQTSLRP